MKKNRGERVPTNLYLVDTRDGENGWLPIFAETRAQAKYNYFRSIEQPMFEPWWEIPVTIQLLAKDVDTDRYTTVDFTVLEDITFETCCIQVFWHWQWEDLERARRTLLDRLKETYYGN